MTGNWRNWPGCRMRSLRLLAVLLPGFVAAPAFGGECVVLLHGLARSAQSMELMAEALGDAGYSVANVDYPSRERPIEELAPMAVGDGLDRCRQMPGGAAKIHFVTHSLGGILVRQYLAKGSIDELGRVVMLGPPNQGSSAADVFADLPGFDFAHGPVGRQLGKGEGSVPLALGPADFELGIIAGKRTIDPLTSAVLDDPDDGRVAVSDTRLEGMSDFVVVDHSHAFLMRMQEPVELTIRFLRTGAFRE